PDDEKHPDPAQQPAAGSDQAPPRRARVELSPGLGVDACGNEIVVRHGCEVNLWQALPPAERTSDGTEVTTVWVGVQYDEEAVEPTRTVFTSGCSDTSDCEFGWTREGFRVQVTSHRPEPDRRCDLCDEPPGSGAAGGCADCQPPVLWLARIDNIDWSARVTAAQIDQSIRRPFGRRVPTVVTGINWIHGHTYSVEEAGALLGTHDPNGGLRVRFSDDVRTEGLRRGVVEIQVIEGGAGRNADTWYMGGQFEDLPETEFVREFRYRQTTRETLQDDDRVMITVRTAFLLDRCCRPVDGTHVGGRVPLIDQPSQPDSADPCALPPGGIGPWHSGTGAGGDVFESWFFVKESR
ncbi:MAG: hypothetical protein J2P15_19135, partial [Micromonosporaceae bacterium]|nr:hypothetical protein [Micromonosporaceae bacterium]